MKAIFTLISLLSASIFFAQVGVNTTNPQSSFEVRASNINTPTNTDGVMIPRVNNFPATNPTAAQDGMMLFATGAGTPAKGFYYWDNAATQWKFMIGAGKIDELSDGKSDIDGSQDGSSVFLGIGAGVLDDATDNQNIGIGLQTLTSNTSGYHNVGIGYRSLATNTTGLANIGIGRRTLELSNGNSNVAIGSVTLSQNNTGGNNIGIGGLALASNVSGSNNIGIGGYALSDNTSGSGNVVIGNIAGHEIIGSYNTVIGTGALGNTTGSGNVAIGSSAGSASTGDNKLFIENSNADSANALIYGEFDTNILRTNGQFQIGVPTGTGYAFPIVDGTANQVLRTDGNGSVNWATPTDSDEQTIDNFSLVGTTLRISLENDGMPLQTVNLASLQDGIGTDDQNLTSATLSGTTLSLGIENGTGASVNLSTLANDWKLTGNSGTAPATNFVGTTDNQDLVFRTNNVEKVRITAKGQIETNQLQSVWIGENAGEAATGTRNTFVGRNSGMATTTGVDNTAIGGLTLSGNIGGSDNTAVGLGALLNMTSGSGNTVIGEQAMENLVSGNFNTVVGHLAGESATGTGNVLIGFSAGQTTANGNKLFIENSNGNENNALVYGEFDNNILRTNGEFQVQQNSSGALSHILLTEATANDGARIRFRNAAEAANEWVLYGRADATSTDNAFNIYSSVSGNVVQITGNGRMGIMRAPGTNVLEVDGNASKAVTGAWLANSDARLKKDIETIKPEEALQKLLSLRGVTYKWDDDKTGYDRPESMQYGFVAQEIQQVFPEKVSTDADGYLQTAYGDYDALVVQSMKAILARVEKLEAENAVLRAMLERQSAESASANR